MSDVTTDLRPPVHLGWHRADACAKVTGYDRSPTERDAIAKKHGKRALAPVQARNPAPARRSAVPAVTRDRPRAEATLGSVELQRIDAYWRACNYLAAGMIYLRDNPLLLEPLTPDHIKNRLLGHWGASPGLSFTYVHLNRIIRK